MATIQVVLDESLLNAANKAVKRAKTNRSALIREALRQHLRSTHIRELEQQDRKGYQRLPQDPEEIAFWEKEIAWPEL